MAYAYPKTNEFGSDSPNWLSSEVGLTLKTYMIKSADVTADLSGKKIVKSGSIFKIKGTKGDGTDDTIVGIIFPIDYDVTNGDLECSVMVGGRVYKNRLPVEPTSAEITALEGRGIIFDVAPQVTRG